MLPVMTKDIIEVRVRAVVPGGGGSGVFLSDGRKSIVIYVDAAVGAAISMFMQEIPKERPLTHDLIASILTALGAKVERVVVNDFQNKTFLARLILSAQNELHKKKIIELDARPSDSIALAIQQKAPIYVARPVWDGTEDMSEVLDQLESGSFDQEGDEDGDDDDTNEDPDKG